MQNPKHFLHYSCISLQIKMLLILREQLLVHVVWAVLFVLVKIFRFMNTPPLLS